jgi:hypothetical protein
MAELPHPMQSNSNATALLNRARLGKVLTAAELVEVAQRDRVLEAEFAILPVNYWYQDIPTWPGHFWTTGDHHIVTKTNPQVYANMTGVRFEPQGVEKLRQQLSGDVPTAEIAPAPTDERKTRHGLPALRDELLDHWHALFDEAYPQGSKALAEESARGMFPNHSVDRQRVRDLVGTKPKGRPPKNKDKS